MKKLITGICCCMLCMGVTVSINAQMPSGMLGKAVGKAAKKLATKATDKAVDDLEKKAEKALGLDGKPQDRSADQNNSRDTYQYDNPEENTYRQGRVNESQGGTYATISEVMAAMPALPTTKELITYKEAEMSGGGLRLVISPVTKFNMEVAALSMQAMQFAYGEMDTAQMVEQAYKAIENSTGLTKADIEKMEKMSDAEQEAYLRSRNVAGKVVAAEMRQAVDVAEYLESIQPKISEWDDVGKKVDVIYENLQTTQRNAYKKYVGQLAKASDKARNAILVKYYSEIVEAQRSAVQNALQVRLKEQMPIAEEIEKYLKGIRESQPDVSNMLLNYPQLTQIAYFSEVARLLDVPEFDD